MRSAAHWCALQSGLHLVSIQHHHTKQWQGHTLQVKSTTARTSMRLSSSAAEEEGLLPLLGMA